MPQKYYVNWILSRLHDVIRRFRDGASRGEARTGEERTGIRFVELQGELVGRGGKRLSPCNRDDELFVRAFCDDS